MPDKKPQSLVQNGHSNVQAQVSPNGRYLAYATDESGKYQIVVQPFPGLGDKKAISVNGGTEPIWGHDGRELYYLAPDGKIMAVSIRTDPDFQVFQTSALFTMPEMTSQPLALGHRYAVRADGQHFLVAPAPNASARVADSTPITVIVNWTPALHK